jgi:hypothetical protein
LNPGRYALLVGLLALWAGMDVLNFGHLGGWLFGRWDFLPNGAYSLSLLALPGILWAYRKQSVPTVSLYVPLLAWWTVLQFFAWRLDSSATHKAERTEKTERDDYEACSAKVGGRMGSLRIE